MAFGFGPASGVTDWSDPTHMFIRATSSGTLQMLAAAIGVPAAKWYGIAESATSAVVAAVAGSNNTQPLVDGGTTTTADISIGILAAEDADSANKANGGTTQVRELAYQHTGQSCGYTPDAVNHEKRNVRDGHYAVWGPLHIYVSQDATKFDTLQLGNAVTVAKYMTGDLQATNLDLIGVEANAGVIPQCAMRVQRATEMGDISSFYPALPQTPCGCYYEYEANGSAPCQSCVQDSDCPSGYTCPIYTDSFGHTHGFCEAPGPS